MKVSTTQRLRRNRGFTLIEMVLVLAIVALLVGAGIVHLTGVLGSGKEKRVKMDLSTLTSALRAYEMDNLVPPNQLQDLVNRPGGDVKRWRQFMKKLPKDPWGNAYEYRNPGQHNPESFDIFSAGPNRVPGDEDDIGNWDE